MRKVCLFAVLAAVALLTACGQDEAVPVFVVPDSILIETIAPETGDIVVMGEYIGTVEANQTVAVLPRVPGEVLSVYFSVGDTVAEGDVLFTIDAEDVVNGIEALEAQLAVQDATVRAAQTGLELVDGAAMESQLLQAEGGIVAAEGGIAQAEAAIRQAEQNVEQSRIGIEQAQMGYDLAAQAYSDTATLFEAGVVAQVQYDQAEAGYRNAVAALERAESGYTMATIGLSQAQQALAQAQQGHAQALEGHRILQENAPEENRRRAQDGLAQARAARNTLQVNLDQARARLADATVTAPIGGIIQARNVEPFNFANPAAPAFIISDQDTMQVSFRVPRNSFEYLSIGDEITLYDGFARHAGTITEIAATVDFGGLIAVRATIPEPPEGLLGGTSVRILAQAARATGATVVPLEVIHYDRGVPHVYVVDDGHARRTQVETGIFDATHIQIVSGLDAGARIISTWSARLADGVEVRYD